MSSLWSLVPRLRLNFVALCLSRFEIYLRLQALRDTSRTYVLIDEISYSGWEYTPHRQLFQCSTSIILISLSSMSVAFIFQVPSTFPSGPIE
jgi:hypothetical protein